MENEIKDDSLTQDDELCNLGIQNGDVCGVSNEDLEDPDPVFTPGCDPTNVGGDDCDDILDTEGPLDPGVLPCGEFDPSDEEEPEESDLGSIPPASPPPCDECLDNPNDPSKCEEPEEAGTLSDLDDCKNVIGTDTFSDCDDDTVATVDSNQTIPGLDDDPKEIEIKDPDVDPVTPDTDPETDPEECIPELDPNNWDCSGNPKPILPLDPDCTPGLLVDNWDCRGNPRGEDDVILPAKVTAGATLDPGKRDTDKDDIPDADDPDDDNDGIPDIDDPNPYVFDDPKGLPDDHPYADPDGDGKINKDDPDDDNDGVHDLYDPNPYDWNVSGFVQVGRPDNDNDDIPDEDDPDDDNDGIPDIDDPEPFVFNKTEDLPDDHPYADPDDDKILNKDDPDDDGDYIPDGEDPDPNVFTGLNDIPDDHPYGDFDNDHIINKNDHDDDNDGIPDVHDDEPFVFNKIEDLPDDHPYADPKVADNDDDGIPDVDDPDDDNDGILDVDDPNPYVFDDPVLPDDHPQADPDGDGKINENDLDDDNDGIPDWKDPNPFVYTVLDNDDDDIPDMDDPDDDNDGIPDVNDPDPYVHTEIEDLPDDNPYADADGDQMPNRLDPDDDNDGILDINDPEPLVPYDNPHGYTYGESVFEIEFLNIVNRERARYGRKPVELDPNLTQASCVQANYQKDYDWDTQPTNPHYGPDENRPCDRLREVGGFRGEYNTPLANENIMKNPKVYDPSLTEPQQAQVAFDFWNSDQNHQVNMIWGELTHIGICQNGNTAVMMSAQPNDRPSLVHLEDDTKVEIPPGSQVRSADGLSGRKRSIDEIQNLP